MVKASRNFPKQPQRMSYRPRRESEGVRSPLMVDSAAAGEGSANVFIGNRRIREIKKKLEEANPGYSRAKLHSFKLVPVAKRHEKFKRKG